MSGDERGGSQGRTGGQVKGLQQGKGLRGQKEASRDRSRPGEPGKRQAVTCAPGVRGLTPQMQNLVFIL